MRDKKGRWMEGESGNPNGRPSNGEALTDILRTNVDKEELATLLVSKARDGEIAAIKYIYDRIDGKPTEKHEVEGNIPTVIFNGIEEPE